MELAQETQSTRPADLYYDAGSIDVNQRWDRTPRPEFSARDAIQRIEHCGAWIVLKRADKNEEYAAVLRECMAELQEFTGLNLNRVMKIQEVILFVTRRSGNDLFILTVNVACCCRSKATNTSAFSTGMTGTFFPKKRSSGFGPWITMHRGTNRNYSIMRRCTSCGRKWSAHSCERAALGSEW